MASSALLHPSVNAASDASSVLSINSQPTTALRHFQSSQPVHTFRQLRECVHPILIPQRRKRFEDLKKRLLPLNIETSGSPLFPHTSFISFPHLPVEIRSRIWWLAANIPRNIKFVPLRAPFPIQELPCVCQPPPPTILFTTVESRIECLRYYTPCIEYRIMERQDIIQTYSRLIYVNFAIDRFVHLSVPYTHAAHQGYNIEYPACFRIQRFALEYDLGGRAPYMDAISTTRPLWDFLFRSEELSEFTMICDFWFFPGYFSDFVTGDAMRRRFVQRMREWVNGTQLAWYYDEDLRLDARRQEDLLWILHIQDPERHWVNQRWSGTPEFKCVWRIQWAEFDNGPRRCECSSSEGWGSAGSRESFTLFRR